MDGPESIILIEVNQRKTKISYDITYMQYLKYDTNKLIYERKRDSETQKNKLTVIKGEGGRIK